jgi:hypothetical protein
VIGCLVVFTDKDDWENAQFWIVSTRTGRKAHLSTGGVKPKRKTLCGRNIRRKPPAEVITALNGDECKRCVDSQYLKATNGILMSVLPTMRIE